jgi:hypothetical protein
MILTGNDSFAWSLFSECTDIKKVVWIENGLLSEIGSTFEKVVIDVENDLLHRVQKMEFLDPSKPSRTVNLTLRLSTFEPLTCSDIGQKNVLVTYLNNEVEVVVDGDIASKSVLVDGVFDLFSLELVLRLLPLEIGYQNRLNIFNHMIGVSVDVHLVVNGLDRVFDGKEDVDAWRIPIDIGGSVQTYWISKETKELLKQSVMVGEGVFFDFIR